MKHYALCLSFILVMATPVIAQDAAVTVNTTLAAPDADAYIAGGLIRLTFPPDVNLLNSTLYLTPENPRLTFDTRRRVVVYFNGNPWNRLDSTPTAEKIEIVINHVPLMNGLKALTITIEGLSIDVLDVATGNRLVKEGDIIRLLITAADKIAFTNPLLPIIRVTTPRSRR